MAGRRRAPVVLVAAMALTLLACEPTLQQASGVVIEVDSPALGQVDSFRLVTPDGSQLEFDTTELRFRPEFPASHLGEHMVLSEAIVVTYKSEDGRLVATQLDDADR